MVDEELQRRLSAHLMTHDRGSYEDRVLEYREVYLKALDLGFHTGDVLLDVGCGTEDFRRYCYFSESHECTYVGVDGALDGTDLETWAPSDDRRIKLHGVDVIVCIEVLEHLVNWEGLVRRLLEAEPRKGIVVTTPNPDVMGIQGIMDMDPDHKTAVHASALRNLGFKVEAWTIAVPSDTLMGWWPNQ